MSVFLRVNPLHYVAQRQHAVKMTINSVTYDSFVTLSLNIT